jgi:serine/threonine-protein kinase
MGDVYLGTEIHLRRKVAIKFLAARFCAEGAAVARFLREAEIAANLDHPNIVPVYSFGELEGRPFFVMKHVVGQTVATLVRSTGRLPLAQAIEIVSQVCEGLEHIHGRGFVHRDVKPQNLLVDSSGRCFLLDFGVLRVAEAHCPQTGLLAGTPDYMAPEQAKDPRSADARSDLYSLAVTLFEMVTGRPPFQAASAFDLMMKHHSEPPPLLSRVAPDLPPALDAFFDQALAKEPAQRFQTVPQFQAALAALSAQPTNDGAPRRSLGPAAGTTPRAAHRRLVGLAAVLLVLGCAAGASWWLAGADEPLLEASPAKPALKEVSLSTPALASAAKVVAAPATPRVEVPRRTPQESRRLVRSKVARAKPVARPSTKLVARDAPAPSSEAKPQVLAHAAKPATERRDLSRAVDVPPPPGALRVIVLHQGKVTWATVFIGGKLVGDTQVVQRKLPPGPHVVTARRPGYRDIERSVTIKPGEAVLLELTLERE